MQEKSATFNKITIIRHYRKRKMKKKEYYAVFGKKSDAEHLANTLGLSVGTIGNWLTRWVKESKLQHVTYGEYTKIA